MTKKLQIIVTSVIVVYLLMQIVMPKLGLAAILNFDTSCYSGGISYLERANSPNASCGTRGTFIGFPFVVNYRYNNPLQKVVSGAIDVLPVAIILGYVARKPKAESKII